MKRVTWWPQAWLGLTFNWGALVGFAAARGGPPAVAVLGLTFGAWARGVNLTAVHPWAAAGALLFYGAGVFWTLGYDTIYAVQDLEDDALAGVRSSARVLGADAPRAVLAFYAVSVALAMAAGMASELGPLFLPVAALAGVNLIVQASRLRMNDPIGALGLFKSNTLAGLTMFIAIVAGHWRAPLF